MELVFWDVVLYSAEAAVCALFFPFSMALFYYVSTTKAIHLNLRLFISIINVSYNLNSIQRLADIIQAIGGTDGFNRLFRFQINYIWLFTVISNTFMWFSITFDRLLAVYYWRQYKQMFKATGNIYMICICLIFFTLGLTNLLVTHSIVHEFLTFFAVFQMFLLILNAIGLGFVWIYCRKKHKLRHENMASLNERHRVLENLRFTQSMLPVAVFQMILVVTLLVSRWFIEFDVKVEKMPQAWLYFSSMSQSLFRLFFVVWLLLTNEKLLRQLSKRCSIRKHKVAAQETEIYANYLRDQWNR